jgi:hypothetical protein
MRCRKPCPSLRASAAQRGVYHGAAVMLKVDGLRAMGHAVDESDIPGLWRIDNGPEITSNQLLSL